MNNMKTLQGALDQKTKDMKEWHEHAAHNKENVSEKIEDLEEAYKDAEEREAAQEKQLKEDIDNAVKRRMTMLEGMERAKLTSDMTLQRECMKANSEAQMKQAHQMALQARMHARMMGEMRACSCMGQNPCAGFNMQTAGCPSCMGSGSSCGEAKADGEAGAGNAAPAAAPKAEPKAGSKEAIKEAAKAKVAAKADAKTAAKAPAK